MDLKYIEQILKDCLDALLRGSATASHDVLNLDASFLELGINSVQAVELVEAMNQKLGIELGVEVIFDYRNVKELAAFIFQHSGKEDLWQELPHPVSKVRSSGRGNIALGGKTPVSAPSVTRTRRISERNAAQISLSSVCQEASLAPRTLKPSGLICRLGRVV